MKQTNHNEIKYNKYTELTQERLQEILDRFDQARIAVIGDGCLDIYWEADMTRSELSRETPHFPLPIINERISLGAGANVAANLAALKLREVSILTVIGDDWRGLEFKSSSDCLGIKTEYIIESGERVTPAYCKPMRKGISEVVYEDPRIDFINYNQPGNELEDEIICKIEQVLVSHDGVIIADQLPGGIISNRIRYKLNTSQTETVMAVDSRNNIGLFNNMILKPNQIEAIKAVYPESNPAETSFADWKQAGIRLSTQTKSSVLMTLGEEGALWFDDKQIIEVPANPVTGPVDIVGAGDAFIAAFLSSKAVGASPAEAISIAHLAAGVTVKKLHVTGTASREEILQRYEEINGGKK